MTKPYPYQFEDAIAVERENGCALLGHEMGLGKSFIALLWASWNPELRPVIIICPAHLKYQWQDECRTHFNLRAEICEGRTIPQPGMFIRHQVLIINYEILGNWLPYLLGIKPKIVIVDEVQYCCNPDAQRSIHTATLCDASPHVLVLSGTPIPNRPIEMWNIFRLYRPDLFPTIGPYADKFCDRHMTPGGWDMRGASNLEELREIALANGMIRRLKKDVLTQLPNKRHVVVPMPILDPHDDYKQAAENYLSWLARYSPGAAQRASYIEGLAKLSGLKRLVARLKMPSVYKWVDDYLNETDEKLIIFAWHQDLVALLHDRYRERSVMVNGTIGHHDRRLAEKQFQTQKRTQIFVGNIRAAGTGLNLTAASNVALVEFDWVPANNLQAIDRAHRIGQREKVTAYWLVAHNTIEHKVCSTLIKKLNISDAVLDGRAGASGLTILSQIQRELMKEGARRGTPANVR